MDDTSSNSDDLNFTGNHANRRLGHAGSAHGAHFRHNYSHSSSDSSFLTTPNSSEFTAGQTQVYTENEGHSLTISTPYSSIHHVSSPYDPPQGPSTYQMNFHHRTTSLSRAAEDFHRPQPATIGNVDWYLMNEAQFPFMGQRSQIPTQLIETASSGYSQASASNPPHSPNARNDYSYLSNAQSSHQRYGDAEQWSPMSQSQYLRTEGPEHMQSPMMPARTIIGHGQTQNATVGALFAGFMPDTHSRTENYTHYGDHRAETNNRLLEVNPHTLQPYTDQHGNPITSECFQPPPQPGTGTIPAVTSTPGRSESRVLVNAKERFPNQPKLQEHAYRILDKDWYLQNTYEPSLSSRDDIVISGALTTNDSWFNLFHDPGGTHRCRWVQEDGKRCTHEAKRKDRATGHARWHFEYKPYLCHGKCGKKGCQEGYTVQSFLQDHVNRKKKPTRECNICQKVLSTQNLKRHMDQVHPEQSPQEPEQSTTSSKKKVGIFGKVRNVFKKARTRSPSRNS